MQKVFKIKIDSQYTVVHNIKQSEFVSLYCEDGFYVIIRENATCSVPKEAVIEAIEMGLVEPRRVKDSLAKLGVSIDMLEARQREMRS